MANDSLLPLSTIDFSIERPTFTVRDSSVHDNSPTISVSQHPEQKPSSSYVASTVGDDNRRFGSSDFQDPLFYQQPLHFHYNQSISSTIQPGHETGDRVRTTNELTFNEYRKRKPISSRKQEKKKKSTHRRYNSSNKTKEKMTTATIKAKEKRKKVLTGNTIKRAQKEKKISRNGIAQLRLQSKTRHDLLLRRRRQKEILLRKKKKLLRERITSKKRSISKLNKQKSSKLNQYDRGFNRTNNRTISPCRSLTSRLKMTPSITRPIDNSKNQKLSNVINSQTNMSLRSSVSQSNTKPMTNVTKRQTLPPSNIPSSAFLHSTISPKVPSNAKLVKKPSKKVLLRSRLNERKVTTSKSKLVKQWNHGTKLNIRSPTHTAFKKKVRRHRKPGSARRKAKFPRCTSKTLITIASTNTKDQSTIKSNGLLNTGNIETKTSPSLFSFKNSLNNKFSSTSTVMPLTKNSAQLTSKNNNNNKRTLRIKRRGSRVTSERKLGRKLKDHGKSTKTTGMTLRSRKIIINKDYSTKRKNQKYK